LFADSYMRDFIDFEAKSHSHEWLKFVSARGETEQDLLDISIGIGIVEFYNYAFNNYLGVSDLFLVMVRHPFATLVFALSCLLMSADVVFGQIEGSVPLAWDPGTTEGGTEHASSSWWSQVISCSGLTRRA